jgi:hypothetical protein
LGSFETKEQLESTISTGKAGDAYLVKGDLYVWDALNSKWSNVGNI